MPPPTAPRAKPFPKARPYVAITASPPRVTPPDPFANLKRSVKRDKNQVITAVLQHPLFASAIISICGTARAFPGSGSDRARFLGATHLRFSDQADFDRLVDQKGLVEALLATLPTLDRRVAEDAPDVKAFFTFADALVQIETNRRELQRKRELEEKRRQQLDTDVVMTASCAAKLSQRLDLLSLAIAALQTDPDGKPKPKKLKVTSTAGSLKPGSDAVLALLSQVDVALESLPSADDFSAPRSDLQKYRDAVELAAQQQLFALDISMQTYRLASDRLARLDKALSSSAVEQAGSLLHALQVSTETPEEDSDIEFQDPPPEDSEDAVEVQAAPSL
ncbi:hypothetical protein C0992_008549 [Termitomyces sp. T32_za158]|nr:hypothetical protein C0992_008549 [Termitomyces sp. T32_za158]